MQSEELLKDYKRSHLFFLFRDKQFFHVEKFNIKKY